MKPEEIEEEPMVTAESTRAVATGDGESVEVKRHEQIFFFFFCVFLLFCLRRRRKGGSQNKTETYFFLQIWAEPAQQKPVDGPSRLSDSWAERRGRAKTKSQVDRSGSRLDRANTYPIDPIDLFDPVWWRHRSDPVEGRREQAPVRAEVGAGSRRREQAPAGRAPTVRRGTPAMALKTGDVDGRSEDRHQLWDEITTATRSNSRRSHQGENSEEPTPKQEKIGDRGVVVVVTQVQRDQEG
jgi:hypothetical protein